jgi:hypothetical protein
MDANQMVVFDYKGIVVFDPDTNQRVAEYSKSEGTYPGGDLVRSIYIDDEGDVWVGSQDPGNTSDYSVPLAMGLSHFDAEDETWTQYKDGVGNVNLGSNMVTAVCRKGNEVYIGHWPESETLPGGATRYNLASNTWKLLNNKTEAVDVSFNAINDIVIDEDNIVWFGTVNGLYRFDPNGTIVIPIGPKPAPYKGLFDPNEETGCFITRIEGGRHGVGGWIIPVTLLFCMFLTLTGFLCGRPRTSRKEDPITRMPAESNGVNKDRMHQ